MGVSSLTWSSSLFLRVELSAGVQHMLTDVAFSGGSLQKLRSGRRRGAIPEYWSPISVEWATDKQGVSLELPTPE